MKKLQKGSSILWVIIIVVILVSGFVYYFKLNRETQEPVTVLTTTNLNNNTMNAKDTYINWKKELYAATDYDDVYNVILPKYYPAKIVESLIAHKSDQSKMSEDKKLESLRLMQRFPSIDQINITEEKDEINATTLYLSSTAKNYSFGGEVHLVKEGDQWKIDYERWNNSSN